MRICLRHRQTRLLPLIRFVPCTLSLRLQSKSFSTLYQDRLLFQLLFLADVFIPTLNTFTYHRLLLSSANQRKTKLITHPSRKKISPKSVKVFLSFFQ